jgi:hypothetical protein
MIKRIGVVMAAAMLAVVALTVPASSQPEPRFTLTINPTEGPVGTNIHAQLPAEATTPGGPCIPKNEIQQGLQELIASLIAGDSDPPVQDAVQKALLGVISGSLPDPNDPNAFKFFFVLAFADPATQRPAIDETTGQESATSFWDPATGQGDITAPPAARPKTYFVAGVCLNLKSLDQVDAGAVIAALAGALQQGGSDFQTCLTTPANQPACFQNFSTIIEQVATAVITELVDQNPDIAWVAPFCLFGDNGETCAAPTAAEAEAPAPAPEEGPGPPVAVVARPRTTG